MASAPRQIDTATNLTSDRTANLTDHGGHSSASFLVDVTAITRTTGTLVVTLSWLTDAGTSLTVATVTGITATGFVRIPLTSDFDATRMAIPKPLRVLWDIVGDTTAVSGSVYAIYGD